MILTLDSILACLSERNIETTWSEPIRQVVIDSREVTPGALFVAIRSGHQHVQTAFDAGAQVAIVSQDVGQDGLLIPMDEIARGNLPATWRPPLCIRVDVCYILTWLL